MRWKDKLSAFNIVSYFRSALAIVWPGFMALSSVLFLVASFPLCYMEQARQRRAALDDLRRQAPEDRTPSPESQESDDKSPVETPTQPLLVK